MIVQDTTRPFRGEWPQATKAGSRYLSSTSPRPDRVVSILSLAERLPDRFIAEALAQSVHAETGGSVLLIHLDRRDVKTSLKDWAKLHPTVNGDFALTRHVEQTEGGTHILRVQVTDEPDQAQWMPSLLRHCAQHFHYLILRVSLSVPMPLLLSAFGLSDRSFLLLRPAAEGSSRYGRMRVVRLAPDPDS